MPDSKHSKEYLSVYHHLGETMRNLHGAILREHGVSPGENCPDAIYNMGLGMLAEAVDEQIMMALASSGSTHLFQDTVKSAGENVWERSKGGKVCPCCGDAMAVPDTKRQGS